MIHHFYGGKLVILYAKLILLLHIQMSIISKYKKNIKYERKYEKYSIRNLD